jgi:hypothetical protein
MPCQFYPCSQQQTTPSQQQTTPPQQQTTPPQQQTTPPQQQCVDQNTQLIANYTLQGKTTAQIIADITSKSSNHDPSSVSLTPEQWSLLQWDGIPLSDICRKTKQELCNFLFPVGSVMRGLREKFQLLQPFCNPQSPTLSEIENWNLEVIKHFRALLGVSIPINFTRELMLYARWADEKTFTNMWNDKYPPICDPKGDVHCGFGFAPSSTDQAPYRNNIPPVPSSELGMAAEGVFGFDPTLSWFVLLSNIIRGTLCDEGLWDHTGPFIHAKELGYSIFINDQGGASFRLESYAFATHPCGDRPAIVR